MTTIMSLVGIVTLFGLALLLSIARMGLKAVLAGTLAHLLSAVLAGLFVSLQAP
jgi:nucleoside permease NupC